MKQIFLKIPQLFFKSLRKSTLLLLNSKPICHFCVRIHRERSWLAYPLYSVGILIWLTTTHANLYQSGDETGWILGSRWLRDCLFQVNFEACQKISYWPIWNNLLAFTFSIFTDNQIHLWFYINTIAFIVYLLVIIHSIREFQFIWRFLIIYSIIFSPLLFLANSTFTEIQQGLFLTLAFFNLMKRRLIFSSFFVTLSIIIKETFIFLWSVVLILHILNETRDNLINEFSKILSRNFRYTIQKIFSFILKCILTTISSGSKTSSLILGLCIGSFLSIGFNYIRYRSFKNLPICRGIPFFPWDLIMLPLILSGHSSRQMAEFVLLTDS